jgi:hypothetical protein
MAFMNEVGNCRNNTFLVSAVHQQSDLIHKHVFSKIGIRPISAIDSMI